DADAALQQVRRQRAGERVDRALGRRVVEQVLAAEQGGFRAGVDDAGALAHVRQRRPRHVDVAGDVGLQGALQLLVVDFLQRLAVLLVGGVVDQHVEPAEFLHRALDHAVAEARIAHVAGDRDAAAPFLLDRSLGRTRVAMLAEVGDEDIRALAGEQHRHRAADAGIAAGDDRSHALELAAAGIARREVARLRIELVLLPGLRLVLPWQRVLRLPARTGLHRLLLRGLLPGLLLGGHVATLAAGMSTQCSWRPAQHRRPPQGGTNDAVFTNQRPARTGAGPPAEARAGNLQ